MSNHKDVSDDEEFSTLLASAGNKLVVVDYNATWCGPCKAMHPVFIQLSHKFPEALFLGVDVDRCRETAMAQGISAMPTFIFYRHQQKLDSVRGANATELEEKIRKHYGQPESMDPHGSGPGGIGDIFPYIDMKGCECLNESDATPFRSFIEKKSKLVSDCDEQLILVYGFNQNVKLQSLKIKAPVETGPKTLKLFTNQPKTLDFDSASSMTPVQEIILKEEDLSGESTVELRFVKFQNVSNLQIFVMDNLSGDETTEIESLTIYGTPVSTTNMTDFKRVAGNKGESH
ncbi:thioredoxin-like protein 1 [Folsomia candida]|uniref:Thioredoxin-like protein 1 n=1 Tax=Folsomia candida TaxID=158441 RepID=A0A226EIJ9_FOLCA|nr:thioredoxin-like protein 1 [Folsomia candida]OXA57289.1 Thioredoxin-like protein 1 [Folsomia candida]